MDHYISMGFQQDEHSTIATLYWQAFGFKLGRVLGPDTRAQTFLCNVLDPDYAWVARNNEDKIIGIAGFKTAQGALVGGDYADLKDVYGTWGGLWRGLLLSVIERDLDPDVLMMDGICVDETARGQGVGTALLDAIKNHASALGKNGVRLDVIDTNPRAKSLYMRRGFETQKIETTGPFRYVFRFKEATQMLWRTDKN